MAKTWRSATAAVRELAIARGLTYSRLSAETGIPKTTLFRFLCNDEGVHSRTLDTLLQHFGLRVVEAPPKRRRRKKGG